MYLFIFVFSKIQKRDQELSSTMATSAPLVNGSKFKNSEQDSGFHGSPPSLSLSEVISEIKLLSTLAFPMILTGLLTYGKSLVSMLFLGKLGKEYLAGGSLAIGIANITGYSVLSGLAMGTEPISSQAFGAKQWPLISQTLNRTVVILLVACVPISALWLNVRPLLVLSGQDPEISAVAATYLAFCLPDLLFQSLINPLKIYLRSQNITLPLSAAALATLILHAPLNSLLTVRLDLGIRGVALASACADLVLLSTLAIYLSLSGHPRCKSPATTATSGGGAWASILSLAIPSCFSVCLEWWWYELMILFAGTLDGAAEAVAAMGILLQATALVYVFPAALGHAASTRVGNELGADQPRKARTSFLVSLFCAWGMSLVAAAFMAGLGGAWGRVFTDDDVIVGLTAAAMPVVGLCELGNCPQTAGCGVLRGSARPNIGVRINLGSFYGVGLPLAVFLGFGMEMGVLGLWLGLLGAQVVCAVVMVWTLSRTDWRVQVNRARELIGIEFEEGEEQQEGLTSLKTCD